MFFSLSLRSFLHIWMCVFSYFDMCAWHKNKKTNLLNAHLECVQNQENPTTLCGRFGCHLLEIKHNNAQYPQIHGMCGINREQSNNIWLQINKQFCMTHRTGTAISLEIDLIWIIQMHSEEEWRDKRISNARRMQWWLDDLFAYTQSHVCTHVCECVEHHTHIEPHNEFLFDRTGTVHCYHNNTSSNMCTVWRMHVCVCEYGLGWRCTYRCMCVCVCVKEWEWETW